ncbi:hypothetical protein Btru_052072 [Bulinus truncatus]|nr:hypothetical protein Btru_052072 [Bulinus truncatus]
MWNIMSYCIVGWTPSVSSCLLTVTVLVISYFIYHLLTNQVSWEKYEVKQVSLGRLSLVDFRQAVVQLIQKHGDTVGIHRGQMTLLTRDVDLLKQIMVKDFNNFVDRIPVMTTTSAIETGVFFLNGQDWRRVRHVITPSFTTGKLKQVTNNIEDSARKLTSVLEECARRDALVPIKYIVSQFTSEIIARSAFGLKTDCIGKEDDEFTCHAKKVFKIRGKIMTMVMLFMFRYKWIQNVLVKNVLVKSRDKLPKTMSDRELIGQSILIIFAGFETTATTLQMVLYLLAKHPDVQERVVQEIQENVSAESPTYDELGHLKYMEQVINETLRLYPPAPIVSRVAAGPGTTRT